MNRFHDPRDWFFVHRFGLFIHWGLYALHGWHEQEQWRARVPREEYVKLAPAWNPTRFDPNEWLDVMEAVGMEYLCVTTKHHDGFCLWDTKQTDYNVMHTPYGRDIIGLIAHACHKRNVPLCLYYSVADWHHPNYPNEGRHHELPPQPGDAPDWDNYLDFVRAQVRELCTNYGAIHGFWWDMNVPQAVDPTINALIRQLQPQAVINNRGMDEGDFGTPERDYEKAIDDGLTFSRPTEACQSIGTQSWGWRTDEDYYSDRHLQQSVAKFLARDANYLLNVGPRPDGAIDDQAVALLHRLGAWYKSVREALVNVTPASHLTQNRDVLLTRRQNTLYVLLHKPPVASAVLLKPIALSPRRATLLTTGESVDWAVNLIPSEHAGRTAFLRLRGLPVNRESGAVLVVKLEFDALSDLDALSTELVSEGDILTH